MLQSESEVGHPVTSCVTQPDGSSMAIGRSYWVLPMGATVAIDISDCLGVWAAADNTNRSLSGGFGRSLRSLFGTDGRTPLTRRRAPPTKN
jgi:hypothetical protein